MYVNTIQCSYTISDIDILSVLMRLSQISGLFNPI